jgi:hypothetical protein
MNGRASAGELRVLGSVLCAEPPEERHQRCTVDWQTVLNTAGAYLATATWALPLRFAV